MLVNAISRYPVATLSLILCACFALLSPGLSGDFILDDGVNIVKNQELHIDRLDSESLRTAALSGLSGPLKRPLSMVTFGINHYYSDLDPRAYKLTNVAIHLANGIGLYLLCLLTLKFATRSSLHALTTRKIQAIALLTAFVWLIHPINISASLYIVQRMNSLAGMFTIFGLISYVYLRPKIDENRINFFVLALSAVLFTVLGTLSKENGALLPALMLAFEIFIFRFATEKRSNKYLLATFFFVTVALPVITLTAHIAANPGWLAGGYAMRNFTPLERLLTESRGIWFYIYLIIIPRTASLGMFHDDFPVSQSLTDPLSTLFALAGITVAIVLALRYRIKHPFFGLGIGIFLIGHSMESGIFGLELIHEHRNYIPSIGILLTVIYYLIGTDWSPASRYVPGVFAGLFIALLSTTTFLRASDWGNPGYGQHPAITPDAGDL